ncbi:uncharacterized protein BKA55DRAFT_532223 [Fusarium redolens]|uniref:Uncharacterized protein n=1 Tax=Fusarium redolens TaxID=48865 RepID=A0A9P9KWE0_FUSRE|nr:uncharacterized protein BKA55DRAFT_532223 [Fusarium redolens]KAH7269570.1 hypothetical protein BKA55DRAFT_532223 [Fusarium redolens]
MPTTNGNQSSLRADALRRLETELNDMVKKGYINISPVHHFKLDEDGVPKVAPNPVPQVSSERLSLTTWKLSHHTKSSGRPLGSVMMKLWKTTPDNLAPRIGRIVGPCDKTRNSTGTASDELKKLSGQHLGLFALVSVIHRCYDRALNSNSLRQTDVQGVRDVQCLRVLIKAVSHANPKDNLDAEVFLSLKNRLDDIANGCRDGSPAY